MMRAGALALEKVVMQISVMAGLESWSVFLIICLVLILA
jgi:hypothetical protein